MNCWEILELEPTSDKKKIKKAYAAKLKTIKVDEEPVAFQKLKEAFDSAIFLSGTIIESGGPTKFSPSLGEINDVTLEEITTKSAKDDQIIEISKEIESDTTDQQLEALTNTKQSAEISKSENETVIQKQMDNVELFEQKLTVLYEKMEFFSEIEKWTPLFSNELEWSIDEYSRISERFKQFLFANYRVLSRQVIEYVGDFFDFDSLIKDYKSGDYFCYTWAEIKHVPPFSFELYSNIPKEQRIDYFSNRYELFQLFDSDIPDHSVWQERLNSCLAVTSKDYDVVNLKIAYLLMNDFRLEKEQTSIIFKELLNKARLLKENDTSDFFRVYYEWAINEGPANNVLIYDKSGLTIPTTTIHLLMGYVYFRLGRQSRVKECWLDIAKKNPSIFKSNELAMLRQVESMERLPKKETSIIKYLWVVFVIILAFIKLGGVFSNTSYTPTTEIETLISGENAFKTDFLTQNVSDLKESENLYDQFLYYFYIEREDEERETFIEEHLAGKAKESAQKMTTSTLPEIDISSRYDFSPSPDNVSEYGFVTALTLSKEEKPFIILQEDEDEKISQVFGEGWEVLPQDKFDALWADIQVRPRTAQNFFVVHYLLSDERETNLKDNSEYVTEHVKKMLERNSTQPKVKEFESGTWQISQDEENKLYTILNDGEGEHCFILSYDSYGRLEHIYGENWEKLDKAKKNVIYDNAEEEIGIY